MPRKKKEEVKIEPDFVPYLREPEILKDTIEAERRQVIAITRKAGKGLSGLLITIGSLLSLLSLQYLVSPLLDVKGLPSLGDLLTSEFIILSSGFLGIINIVCGLILLAKE